LFRIDHAIVLKIFFFKENTCHIASGRAGNVIGGGDWADNRIIPDMMRAYKNSTTIGYKKSKFGKAMQHVLEPLFGYLKLGENY